MSWLTLTTSVLLLVVLAALPGPSDAGVTVDQMAQTAVMMKQACQPKTKASDENIAGLKNKIFPENKETKCFVYCVLEMMQVMKKGKVQKDVAIRSIRNLMPEELQDDQVDAIEACATSAVGIKDNCEAGYAMLKCQAANAKNFMFVG